MKTFSRTLLFAGLLGISLGFLGSVTAEAG